MTCFAAFLLGAMCGFALPFVYFGVDAYRHRKRWQGRRDESWF